MVEFDKNQGWTLFLDRDGVINERNFEGYITRVTDFKFKKHAIEGLKRLANYFSNIFVVTNQQGVGKGIMTAEDLTQIHSYMKGELAKHGVHITKIYVATNLRGAIQDERKPSSVMGQKAKSEYPELVFKQSIMVGDTNGDILFGQNLGMKTVLIKSAEEISATPDLIVNDLIELADELEK